MRQYQQQVKMRKNKQLASFLDFTRKTTFRFAKVKAVRLIDQIKEHCEKMLTSHFVKKHQKELATPLFQFQVDDTYKKWIIVKKFEDFLQLRDQLKVKYPDKLLPIPVETVEDMQDQELLRLLQFFQHFLNVLGAEESAEEDIFYWFAGAVVSTELKMKIYYQGVLAKRAGGRHNESNFKKFINMFTTWNDRLVSISPEGIYLCLPSNLQIEDTIMFSSTFSFLYGEAATGFTCGLIINSSQRILSLDARNIFNLVQMVRFLSQALDDSEITSDHRFSSFAPLRLSCDAKFYIDGEYYFYDLCEALLSAKKQIFITGWMISPYFLLKRPDPEQKSRIDNVLSIVANAGIKVNIIVYNGPKMALNIDSEFTQTYLSSLSPNIKVLLHPNYVLIPFLWSHHEKMVIIDQKIGFMGGLDIGYGRFDTKEHLLSNPKDGDIWTGVDFCNYRVTDILKPQLYQQSSIEAETTPRMPWHDIGVRLVGGSVQDLARHFIQYWNYVNFQMNMNDRELLMYVGMNEEDFANADDKSKEEIIATTLSNRQSMRYSSTNDPDEEGNFTFLNFLKPKNELELKRKHESEVVELPFELEPEEKQFFSSQATCLTEVEEEKEKEFYLENLQETSILKNLISRFHPKNLLNYRLGTSFEQVTLSESMNYDLKPEKKRVQRHQILRSAAMWSIGLQQGKDEHSILNAYLFLISNAKEYIYIENQFFISERNGIAEAIVNRIIKAHFDNQKFRVVIMIPALPGFDGHPADEKAAVFRVQVNLVLKTINKMYNLLSDTIESNQLLRQYIYVFSLRTHGWVNDKPVTEIIYIHSKMMIVDDRIALIGSANINDRSLKGGRDTELAVTIEDQQTIEIDLGDKKREVSVFAHSLRKQLYMEHFNLTSKQAEDYYRDDVWSLMIETAKKNHQIYRLLFGCYPDNKMATFEEMQTVKKEANSSQFEVLKLGIKSNAIPFQRYFLRSQSLALRPSQKEYFVPEINFT